MFGNALVTEAFAVLVLDADEDVSPDSTT
jgi:hypothetical protein